MPRLTFLPSGKGTTVPPGTELLDAARQAGVELEAPCGGGGTCGKCLVQVISGRVDSEKSLGVLSRSALAEGYVLACQTRVSDADVTFRVPEQVGRMDGRLADTPGDRLLVLPELFPTVDDYEPLSLKVAVEVSGPQLQDGLSDLDRLTRRLQLELGKQEIVFPLEAIRDFANTLRIDDGTVTVTLVRHRDRLRVLGIEPGDSSDRHYGVAVDIGTTTVAVQLVHLPTGRIVGTTTDYNAQISCGLDVISRINYARRPERLQELKDLVLRTINRLLHELAAEHHIGAEEISSSVLAGNTTMVHLLLGLNPEYIRLEPYTPTVLEVPCFTAREIGLEVNPLSRVHISPGVGSYVGGDISAGLLCTQLATDSESISLFIDIGTNGELVVGNGEFLMTCACSAGPAFEGGGISCGMRAAPGAIERVEVDGETGIASCWTTGSIRPIGICGSGMISLVANLFRTGWVDAAGKLDRVHPSAAIRIVGRHAVYRVVAAEESGTGQEVVITEADIENIVRAKAAIYSAAALMLQHIDVEFGQLHRVYIAGGFGRHLDLGEAVAIGLIPDLPLDKFQYIGNASLMGAYMVLVSRKWQERQLELARKMTYIDLSSDANYMNQYTAALFLPHTDSAQFPSVAANPRGKAS